MARLTQQQLLEERQEIEKYIVALLCGRSRAILHPMFKMVYYFQ
jgi:hypothetical protein